MAEFQISPDLTHSQSFEITKEHSADHLGSGTVSVLSTPSMILFMEIVAGTLLQKQLPKGYSSVGIEINVRHLKAIKIGETAVSYAQIKEIDGKKITFSVKVKHKEDILGEGTHTRYIIEESSFLKSLTS